MTGKGTLSHKPETQTQRLMIAAVGWLVFVVVLSVWWGNLLLTQATRIQELELKLGASALASAEGLWRTHRMVFWEGLTLIALLVALSASVIWMAWRERRRARAIQAFFASVTHELKTPLASIRLQAESISDRYSTSTHPGDHKLVQRLLEDTLRLESQVERVLELARVEGGGQLHLHPISLRALLENTLPAWRETYRGRIRFEIEVEDGDVLADVAAVQMILRNAFENSLRHSGREEITVRLRSARMGALHWELQVLDNGQGFGGTTTELGRLFYKGARSSGAGVGLYLTQALMKRMGGEARFLNRSATRPSDEPTTGFVMSLKFLASTGEAENG